MPPDEPSARTAIEETDGSTPVAAVRAGIDAVPTRRAPAERDAFWRAVALHCAPPPKRREPPGPHDEAETSR